MEEKWNSRTELLIGKDGIEKLKRAKVAVYGIGGVGSFVVEGLARVGIGHLILIDQDIISISNLNRQIHATHETLGKSKTEVMKQRILQINPELIVETYHTKDVTQGEENLIDTSFSYVIDAVDTIATKIQLIEKAKQVQVPILSCMGTGNKLNPSKLEIADLKKTSICPLARIMRKELRKRNITSVKVLYSKEDPIRTKDQETIGSVSFVPSVAGLMIAGEVVKDILKERESLQKTI